MAMDKIHVAFAIEGDFLVVGFVRDGAVFVQMPHQPIDIAENEPIPMPDPNLPVDAPRIFVVKVSVSFAPLTLPQLQQSYLHFATRIPKSMKSLFFWFISLTCSLETPQPNGCDR